MLRNLTLFSVSVHDALNSLEKNILPYSIFHEHKLKEWDYNSVIAGCGETIGSILHPARKSNFKKHSIFASESSITKVKIHEFGCRVSRFILNMRKR